MFENKLKALDYIDWDKVNGNGNIFILFIIYLYQ